MWQSGCRWRSLDQGDEFIEGHFVHLAVHEPGPGPLAPKLVAKLKLPDRIKPDDAIHLGTDVVSNKAS